MKILFLQESLIPNRLIAIILPAKRITIPITIIQEAEILRDHLLHPPVLLIRAAVKVLQEAATLRVLLLPVLLLLLRAHPLLPVQPGRGEAVKAHLKAVDLLLQARHGREAAAADPLQAVRVVRAAVEAAEAAEEARVDQDQAEEAHAKQKSAP